MNESKRILFVDDDPNIQKMVEIFLRRENYNITFAKNGRSALKALENEQFDLIISDMQMPEMDGLAFIEALKKEDSRTPVLVVSAFGQESMAQQALEKGASSIIDKPFESRVLISAINDVINTSN